VFVETMFFISKNGWLQLLRTFTLAFYLQAGCKVVSLSREAFTPVLSMSRRLR